MPNKKINIVLISCVSQKTPFKNMAKDLYVSSLFKKSWQYTKELIKPDGVKRQICGEILTRYERKGLIIKAMKLLQTPKELAQEHYAEHKDNTSASYPSLSVGPPASHCP